MRRMNAFEGLEPQRGPGDYVPKPRDLELFAHVEGLVGEEASLLAIPHEDRSQHHHERLKAIGEELDRAFEKLRERAERVGHRSAGEHGG
jgi:Protein of unknown function (DUF2630)